mmetsp:Transcript_50385/g.82356  ORF Transcript_50385/g.82356 Transcript_50385/m.82356 type:complete len:104 (+) Transcript_50385:85-396(+)
MSPFATESGGAPLRRAPEICVGGSGTAAPERTMPGPNRADQTHSPREDGNGGPKQRLGGPSLKEREGKGSEWRSASGRRQLQTRTQDHGFLPKPPLCSCPRIH